MIECPVLICKIPLGPRVNQSCVGKGSATIAQEGSTSLVRWGKGSRTLRSTGKLVRGVQLMTREGRIQARVFISVQQWLLTKKIKKGNTHARAHAHAHMHTRAYTRTLQDVHGCTLATPLFRFQKYNNPHSVSTHSKNTSARSPFIELGSSHFRIYNLEVHSNLQTKQN